MPNPRQTRLLTDYQKVQQLIAESGGALRLVRATGSPPTTYVIEYNCPSLVKDGEHIAIRRQHRVEIKLAPNHPFNMPTARMLTSVFNPHVFFTQAFCLGGYWSPVETLDTLVLRIGAILQWDPKVINLRSLANLEAGEWARKNPSQLPLPGAVQFKAAKKAGPGIQWS